VNTLKKIIFVKIALRGYDRDLGVVAITPQLPEAKMFENTNYFYFIKHWYFLHKYYNTQSEDFPRNNVRTRTGEAPSA